MRNKVVALTIALTIEAQVAFADDPAPMEPYKKVVGENVFVMLPGRCGTSGVREMYWSDAELDAYRAERLSTAKALPVSDPCSRNRANATFSVGGGAGRWRVRLESYEWFITSTLPSESGQRYEHSGLFPGDGSVVPLWTVDWYATQTYLSKDGRFHVRIESWPSNYDDLAVAFYDRGKLLREYVVTELVSRPEKLPHTVSHFSWLASAKLNDASKTFRITTLQEDAYVFDITSGDSVETSTRAPTRE